MGEAEGGGEAGDAGGGGAEAAWDAALGCGGRGGEPRVSVCSQGLWCWWRLFMSH